jgi:hypothetical protein
VAPPLNYQPPVAQIVSPPDGFVTQDPTNLTLAASVVSNSAPIAGIQFVMDGTALGSPLTGLPYVLSGQVLYPGVHAISAVVTDIFGVVVSSPTNTITVLTPAVEAVFRGTDLLTSGNWQTFYGRDGYVLPVEATNVPTYAAFTLTNCVPVVWTSFSQDGRAFQTLDGAGRFAGAWSETGGPVLLDINFIDGNAHRVSLYAVDWLGQGGTETFQVLDATQGTLLDARDLSGFTNGAYLAWNVAGHVQFALTRSPGNLPAVVSGVFFDPASSLPAIEITAPVQGAFCNGTSNIVVMAQTPVDPTLPVGQVAFYASANYLGAVTNGPPYVFEWSDAPPGLWFLSAREIGSFGSADSPPVQVIVFNSNSICFFGAHLLPDQSVRLDAFGPSGVPLVLEAASDLSPTANWVPVLTNTPLNNSFYFQIPSPLSFPQQFYRAVWSQYGQGPPGD